MPVVVKPYTPPPPPPPVRIPNTPRSGVRNILTGWDGTEWELNNPDTGVVLIEGGVRGLGMPPVSHYRDQSPALAGSYWRGTRTEDRVVVWPLYVYHDGSEQDWITHNAAFWRTLWPGETSTWRVIQPAAQTRYLDVRYESGGDEPFDADPSYRGWALYVVTLTAEQPYWRGDAVSRFFPTSDPSTLGLNWTGPGVLNIFAGSSLQSATIPNPGDRPARVTWTLTGPLDSARMGVGSKLIDVPFPLDDGETLTVYTAPDLMMAVDSGGVDRTRALGLGSNLTGEIPPGGEASLSVEPVWTAPGGSVTATLVPLYYMAF